MLRNYFARLPFTIPIPQGINPIAKNIIANGCFKIIVLLNLKKIKMVLKNFIITRAGTNIKATNEQRIIKYPFSWNFCIIRAVMKPMYF